MEFDSNITSAYTRNVSQVSSALSTPTLIVYISFSILGIGGNGLDLFVIARVKYLQDTTNLLIVNQSLIDGISSILLLVNFVLPNPPLPGKNQVLAKILCGIWYSQYTYWATYIASIINLLLLTLERYFAVVYPIRYRRHVKLKRVIGCSFIPWMIGFLHMSYLITLTKVNDGSCLLFMWPNQVMQPAMGIYTFIMYFIITFTAMFWMYYRIMQNLRQVPKPVVGSVHQVKDYRGLARRNAVKTMLSLSLCYATCWAPNQFTYLLYCLGVNIDLGGTFYYVTVSFAVINMWINPFVYTFQYNKFQSGLKTVFGCARHGREIEIKSAQTIHTIDTPLSQA